MAKKIEQFLSRLTQGKQSPPKSKSVDQKSKKTADSEKQKTSKTVPKSSTMAATSAPATGQNVDVKMGHFSIATKIIAKGAASVQVKIGASKKDKVAATSKHRKSSKSSSDHEKAKLEAERQQLIKKEIASFFQNNAKELFSPVPHDHDHEQSTPTVEELPKEVTETHRAKDPAESDFCEIGEIVGEQFEIKGKLREGGFGQIYKAYDSKRKISVAVKVESPQQDNMEHNVLRQFQGKPHCPVLYAAGTTENYSFMVMQLLGKNMADLRRLCMMPKKRLSVSATLRVGCQCLDAIKALHEIGYLHRDIKPPNFAIGSTQGDNSVVFMLDYGLCRYYLLPNGEVRHARAKRSFRGTVRYASLNVHENIDLSRRDDLLSLFYTFYELLLGNLPWRHTNDMNAVGELKKSHTPEIMVAELPQHVQNFVTQIKRLKYADRPHYAEMHSNLTSFMKDLKANWNDPYDWQIKDCRNLYHFYCDDEK